ncbi:MAG: prolyl oligopeptidase family serine peptidase [Phycisphaeraceae bacterium]
MYSYRSLRLFLMLCLLLSAGPVASAQGAKADYERSAELSRRFNGKVTQQRLEPVWVGDGEAFWFRTDEDRGAMRWVAVDSATGKQQPAFDHARLAAALGEAAGRRIGADRLRLDNLRVEADASAFSFDAFEKRWAYTVGTGEVRETEAAPRQDNRDNSRRDRWRDRGGSRQSPDKRWTAEVVDRNVVIKPVGEDGRPVDDGAIRLTADGTADHGYTGRFYWSPDSTQLVAMKRKAGDDRFVTIVDSTPDDQLQPKTQSYFYLKPGDQVPIDRPVLFDIAAKQAIDVSDDLAPNPYDNRGVRWRRDSSAFTYEYNQRGHQVYRVIEVDAQTGESRAIVTEAPETFFCYSRKKFLRYLDDTDELIWMSERDGWNHLYLIDWKTGGVKRQITKGEWVVREVDRVDEPSRTVWFWAGGIHEGQDPYYRHYCKANLDTGEVTALTRGNGDHTDLSVSPDGKHLVTTWSRVDHPPVHELRNAETGALIKELARADASALVDAGWQAPERFVAKGRDGETDIYGIIVRPTNFDPDKQYPVIEQIYAGPHGAHVPKRFYPMLRNMELAELGFVVVQIDGMGTSERSKAFHDVCWKDLGDAGFPDRIAWMKAAAKDRPWMDIARVGIYGGSAGGQNAMRAVLDHAAFYKAAAADCGCHDNRMDKIWWNEQWMGWPVGEQYETSSNAVDAHKLGGKLLLTVGELDRNVDPASTMQVVDALIKADKDFELMVFTGKGHGAGESAYGKRLRRDFFVRHLMGVEPRWE